MNIGGKREVRSVPEIPLAGVDDLDLAERAAAGDRGAFETIYKRHVNRVYGLSLRLTADVTAAETLTQDTFIRAWSAIGGYAGRGNLGGWLGRIAVNLNRDAFRRHAQNERMLAEAVNSNMTPTSTGGGVIPLLTGLDLERCIGRLPHGARTVFVLHAVEGYPHKEIAELMDIATGTVKAQFHRARNLLQGMLMEERTSSS